MTHPQVGLDHLTLLGTSPPDIVLAAHAAGFDTVGLRVACARECELPWPMLGRTPMLRETLARLDDTGVRVHAVEIIRFGPQAPRTDLESVLETGATLGARHVAVMGDDPDRARLCDRLGAFAAAAKPYGLTPLVEPMAYLAVNTLSAALELAATCGTGVLLDALHFRRCGMTLDEIAAADPALFPTIQLCDAPAVTPPGVPRPDALPRRQPTNLSDAQLESLAFRLLPGQGQLDVVELLGAMPEGMAVTVESPSLPLLSECSSAVEVARRARAALGAVLERARALGEPRSDTIACV